MLSYILIPTPASYPESRDLAKKIRSKGKRVGWTDFQSMAPNVGRVAQRRKKFNQFYCLIMILGCKRNSKFPKVKKNLKPYWRAGGPQAENSAIFWLNWLCV